MRRLDVSDWLTNPLSRFFMHNKQQANAMTCQHKYIRSVITVGSLITDYYDS